MAAQSPGEVDPGRDASGPDRPLAVDDEGMAVELEGRHAAVAEIEEPAHVALRGEIENGPGRGRVAGANDVGPVEIVEAGADVGLADQTGQGGHDAALGHLHGEPVDVGTGEEEPRRRSSRDVGPPFVLHGFDRQAPPTVAAGQVAFQEPASPQVAPFDEQTVPFAHQGFEGKDVAAGRLGADGPAVVGEQHGRRCEGGQGQHGHHVHGVMVPQPLSLPETPPSYYARTMVVPNVGTSRSLPEPAASRYHSARLVGQGGMGTVFRAIDGVTGAVVAVKVLRPEFVGESTLKKRFRREIQALQSVQNPHVVACLDAAIDGPEPYLVMEFADGETLNAAFERGPLETAEAVDVVAQVCEGLGALHAVGLVHRDVKPDNIAVAEGPHARIMDLGLVRVEPTADETALTLTGCLVGTVGYMAPEVVAGGTASAAADVFSVGVVLYQALTGVFPLNDAPLAEVATGAAVRRVPAPSQVRPDLGNVFDGVVRRAMAFEPERRYPSVCALRTALLRAAAASTLRGAPPAGRRPASSSSLRLLRTAPLPAAVSLLLLLLGFIFFFLHPTPPPAPSLPRELSFHRQRGRLDISWQVPPGAVTGLDWRRVGDEAWSAATLGPTGAVIDGLVPGERYQLRMTAADGRTSAPRTFEGPYSHLQSPSVEPGRSPTAPAVLRLWSPEPVILAAAWLEGSTGDSASWQDEAPTPQHDVAYHPARGPLFRWSCELLGKGRSASCPLPADELATLVERATAAAAAPAVLDGLHTQVRAAATPQNPAEAREQRAWTAVLGDERLRRLYAIGALAALVLDDEGLPLARRIRVADGLVATVGYEKLTEYYYARRPLFFEPWVVTFMPLLVGPSPTPTCRLGGRDYPDGRNLFLPPEIVGRPEARRIAENMGTAALVRSEPRGDDEFDVEVSVDALRGARRLEVVVDAMIFAPSYVVLVRIDDTLSLPYHYDWGILNFGGHGAGRPTFDKPRSTVPLAVGGRRSAPSDLMQRERLTRSVPVGLLHVGTNRVRVMVRAPFGVYDDLAPIVRSVHVQTVGTEP